jgi:TonB family protein
MPKFLTLSAFLHIVMIFLLGSIIGLPAQIVQPITVSILETVMDKNRELPTGKIVELPEIKREAFSEKADLLANADSRAALPVKKPKDESAEPAIPVKKLQVTGREGEKSKMPEKPHKREISGLIKPAPSQAKENLMVPDRFSVKPSSPPDVTDESEAKTAQETDTAKKEPQPAPVPETWEKEPEIMEEQTGETLLEGDEIDTFVLDNPNSFFENDDEAIISLNTKKFEYADYFSEIKKEIEKVWYYPDEAVMKSIGGSAVIRFTLLSDGDLYGTSVVSSSGDTQLHEASIEAVTRAAPFKPFPRKLAKKRIHVIANFSYQPVFNPVELNR